MHFSKAGKSVLVLYDRYSRYTCLLWRKTKKAQDVTAGLRILLDSLPENRRKSLTFDNGQEFRLHLELAKEYGLKTFFCDPHSPWQKGGVENTIGRLRRFLPRNTNPDTLSSRDLALIMEKLNNTPRKSLGFKTPAEVFFNQTVALQT
jgi:IS30 family transposase